jgi:hypothetical protein
VRLERKQKQTAHQSLGTAATTTTATAVTTTAAGVVFVGVVIRRNDAAVWVHVSFDNACHPYGVPEPPPCTTRAAPLHDFAENTAHVAVELAVAAQLYDDGAGGTLHGASLCMRRCGRARALKIPFTSVRRPL